MSSFARRNGKRRSSLRLRFFSKKLLKDTDVLFIVDDHIDIALLSGADGVHVGQEDIDPKYVRQLLGPDAVVGLSVGSIAELNTIGPEVDYIGIGPVFSTKTKVDAGAAVGLDLLEYISKEAGLPNVAIGGLNKAMPRTALSRSRRCRSRLRNLRRGKSEGRRSCHKESG